MKKQIKFLLVSFIETFVLLFVGCNQPTDLIQMDVIESIEEESDDNKDSSRGVLYPGGSDRKDGESSGPGKC